MSYGLTTPVLHHVFCLYGAVFLHSAMAYIVPFEPQPVV